jgi:hypothetical protein
VDEGGVEEELPGGTPFEETGGKVVVGGLVPGGVVGFGGRVPGLGGNEDLKIVDGACSAARFVIFPQLRWLVANPKSFEYKHTTKGPDSQIVTPHPICVLSPLTSCLKLSQFPVSLAQESEAQS